MGCRYIATSCVTNCTDTACSVFECAIFSPCSRRCTYTRRRQSQSASGGWSSASLPAPNSASCPPADAKSLACRVTLFATQVAESPPLLRKERMHPLRLQSRSPYNCSHGRQARFRTNRHTRSPSPFRLRALWPTRLQSRPSAVRQRLTRADRVPQHPRCEVLQCCLTGARSRTNEPRPTVF